MCVNNLRSTKPFELVFVNLLLGEEQGYIDVKKGKLRWFPLSQALATLRMRLGPPGCYPAFSCLPRALPQRIPVVRPSPAHRRDLGGGLEPARPAPLDDPVRGRRGRCTSPPNPDAVPGAETNGTAGRGRRQSVSYRSVDAPDAEPSCPGAKTSSSCRGQRPGGPGRRPRRTWPRERGPPR